MSLRVGIGYDVHQLKKGLPFILGGIQIQHKKGAFGHSDADVLIHAICDAILGAACLGDIGTHFPDNSDEFKDIDSKILLKKVAKIISQYNYCIENIDATISLQAPKISHRIKDMRICLSEVLNLEVNKISIKATTTEKLGFVGEEKGIAAHVVVLISN